MAEARALRHPPIQEAVIQFAFAGVDLKATELRQLAAVYVSEGWEAEELHSFAATVKHVPKGKTEVSTGEDFVGYILTGPSGVDLVQLRAAQVSGSTRRYTSWEALVDHARAAFERFVEFARPAAVNALSARFINRIPPYSDFGTFDQILTRPPVPIEGLANASIVDFLRRHVVHGLDGDFEAVLTIGTVGSETQEDQDGRALVIDTDVRKVCDMQPSFDLFAQDLATLRGIKNKLFFGSLKDEIVERFK